MDPYKEFVRAATLVGALILALAASLLAAAPSSSAATQPGAARPATPLGASIFIEDVISMRHLPAAVDAAAARGHRRLNVVVTLLAELDEDLRVRGFGLNLAPYRNFRPFDDGLRQELQRSLQSTFARMVEHDMDIFILCHLDSAGQDETWRNWIDFDPLAPCRGYSYEDALIAPVAEALAESVDKAGRVELALAGEMGTSLFRYPASYRTMLDRLRERPELATMRVGVSLNHSDVAGEGSPSGAADIVLDDGTRAALQNLLEASDFVGMSFYRPVTLPVNVADFVIGVEHFAGELAGHGLRLPTEKPLHFSEVGIGGGFHDRRATDEPAEAVQSPWAGCGDGALDPWRTEAMRQMRREYHDALLKFLAGQPARWPVSAAFLWSTGSWDPEGLRHNQYRDPVIEAAIHAHNRGAASRN